MTRPEEIDRLRPMPAARLLAIWRDTRERTEEPLERCLLCNAQVLAECCWRGEERAFASAEQVLAALTGRQMEALLRRLMEEEPARAPDAENPAFDPERFRALREG
ncbi:hypothetical protein [Dysosmobacter sp.]|uniref:hypothetical protein n=1 Tax=Dysosmobacter sp. TaxID=2591382 RepID=UPI003AB8ACC9